MHPVPLLGPGDTMTRVIIIGATSAIAGCCARLWAERGALFHLVARDAARLEQVAQDLRMRGAAAASVHVADVRDRSALGAALSAALADGKPVDVALVAHGTLPDQERANRDAAYAAEAFDVNATATISAITLIVGVMEAQGAGSIAVISSVAGDRGRASNHLYGAAKGAVSLFCEGLRARLLDKGVHVLTVKPGFVDTPMTAGLALPRALVATPEQVARDIVRGVERRRQVIYTPSWWRLIMLVIKLIPSPIFMRLKI